MASESRPNFQKIDTALANKPPSLFAMKFPTPIMTRSRFLLIFLSFIHNTTARPQGLVVVVDTPTSFLPEENPLGQSSGYTQLIASGDTSSGRYYESQQPWPTMEDPNPFLLAGANCNDDAAPNQILHSRSRRSSFTKRGGEICSPADGRTQLFKQPDEERQQPARDAAQPLPPKPASGNAKRPGREGKKRPTKGIRPDVLPMYNAIYNFPGVDGQPNDEVCNISGHPLLRVPICAPAQPYSPISMVLPARFCKLSLKIYFLIFLIFF